MNCREDAQVFEGDFIRLSLLHKCIVKQARSYVGAFGGSAKVYNQKNLFKHIIKTKIFLPKNVLFPPNLKTWLRACC